MVLPTFHLLQKSAQGGVLFLEELSVRAIIILRCNRNFQGHNFKTQINQARTELDHARTEPFLTEIVISFDSKHNSKRFLIRNGK